MKKLYCIFFTAILILTPLISLAAEPDPGPGLARIKWAMTNAGPMPKGMTAGLVGIVIMIIITVLYAKLTLKGENTNE